MKRWVSIVLIGFASISSQALSLLHRSHEALNSVLYVQTAGEYKAVALQVYAQARMQLDQALADPAWTAALEQTGAFGSLPPAVVLNVDETVLDNSPYEAYLVDQDKVYTSLEWLRWVESRMAGPIPGALEFAQYAASKGVRIFYVTNRAQKEESATLATLQALGFPVDADGANLMCTNEMPDWTGDKTTRRQLVAQTHRILLLVGNGLNDYVSGSFTGVAARNALVEQYKSHWGEKWFILPTDMYGSWERALYNFSGSPSREDLLRIKFQNLKYMPDLCPASIDWTQLRNHELLNSVVWRQSAGESLAVSWQAFCFARKQLDRALANPAWTAALEQTDDAGGLPPAIILDIDETIIDTSPSQASLAINGMGSFSQLWFRWFGTGRGVAVPGVVEFLQYATSKGVRVLYMSNRSYASESGTMADLQALGCPVEADGGNVVSNGEMEGWGGDKTTRRHYAAQTHRILLLVGDDLNDFFTGSQTGVAPRNALAEQYKSHWGGNWIVLPNSQYGGWERALYNHVGFLSHESLLQRKYDSLILPESIFPSSVEPFDRYQ